MVRSMRTGLIEQDVRDDFDRARRRANRAKMAGWLLGRPASRNRLAVLGEVTSAGGRGRRLEYERVGRPGPAAETVVPVSQIVGTLEPTTLFDRQFRPTSDYVRARFQRIAAEVRAGRGMDPVELYRCSGSYYVLDGRHRIAVAHALGQRSVSALVTEVRLNKPGPGLSGTKTARDAGLPFMPSELGIHPASDIPRVRPILGWRPKNASGRLTPGREP